MLSCAISSRTPRLCSHRLALERVLIAALQPITSRCSRLALMSLRSFRTELFDEVLADASQALMASEETYTSLPKASQPLGAIMEQERA